MLQLILEVYFYLLVLLQIKTNEKMEVKILQIPESQFNELVSKIERLQENQNRIFDIAQQEHLFDTKYLQDLLNVSQKTMQGFRDKGDIEFIQIGGLVRYKKSAVQAFLSKYTHPIRKRRTDPSFNSIEMG